MIQYSLAHVADDPNVYAKVSISAISVLCLALMIALGLMMALHRSDYQRVPTQEFELAEIPPDQQNLRWYHRFSLLGRQSEVAAV